MIERCRLAVALVAALVVALPCAAAAQRLPEPPPRVVVAAPPTLQDPAAERRADVRHAVIIGTGYAAGGMLAGLYVAAKLPCRYTRDYTLDTCAEKDIAGALLGAAAIGALGTHIGNRFGGSLAATTAAGMGVATAGVLAHRATHDGRLPLPTAMLSLAAMVGVERLTTRPRAPGPSRAAIAAIPAWQLRNETRAKYSSLYGFGGVMLGGVGGFVAGAVAGYHIQYPRDIARGCEDCGLAGLALGGLVGGLAGVIAGGILGGNAGRRIDEAEAAARILGRR